MSKFPEKGEVVLMLVNPKAHNQVLWASPVRDRRSGKHLGVPVMSEERMKHELPIVITPDSQCKIEDGKKFDLDNNEIDRLEWAYVKHNKEIVASIEEAKKNNQAMFYVYRPGAEAEKKVTKARDRAKALGIVSEMPLAKLRELCTYFGIKTDYMATSEIEATVFEKAEKEPSVVIAATEDRDFAERILIYKLIDAKKLRKNMSGHLLYGDVLVGQNVRDAVNWIKDPKNRDVAARLYLSLRDSSASVTEGSLVAEFEKELEGDEDPNQ